MKSAPITVEGLKALLHYDPLTGAFTWRVDRSWKAVAGSLAGCDCGAAPGGKKRVVIGIDGRLYRAGRLAWFYMTGKWPTQVIDHEDGDYKNHRWANLRDVSNKTNVENQRRAARSNKSSGLLGVTHRKDTQRWSAQIKVDQVNKALGCFDSPEAAHEAYLEAKRRLHAGCTI